MRFGLWLALAVFGTALLPNLSKAEEAPWEFRLTPYVWVPALSLESKIGTNPSTDGDSSILDFLDFGFLATGEIRKGNWGLILEFNYLDLGADATYLGGRFGAEADLTGVMGGVAVDYRFFKNDRFAADVFGGVRVWSLEARIDFNTLPTASQTKTWADPLVGARAGYDINKNFFIDGLVDVGGFGVGSDLQWEALARVGYRLNKTMSLALGYRHLFLDFSDDKLVINTTMTGPFLAVDFNW